MQTHYTLTYSLEMPRRPDLFFRLVREHRTDEPSGKKVNQGEVGGKKVKIFDPDFREKISRIPHDIRDAALQAVAKRDADICLLENIPLPLLPTWKNLKQQHQAHDLIRLITYQEALSNTNFLIPFSWNLSPALLEKANGSAGNGLADFIYRALSRNLKNALNLSNPPQLWFVIEFDKTNTTGRPHIHGALSADYKYHRKIREAFHKTNVDYHNPEFKKHAIQLHIKRRESNKNFGGDIAWASYALKDSSSTRIYYLPGEKFIAADQKTRRAAKEIWDALKKPEQHQPIDKDSLLKNQLARLAEIKETIQREEKEIEESTQVVENKQSDDDLDDLTETLAFLDKEFDGLDEIITQANNPTQRITPGIQKYLNYFADSPPPKKNKSRVT